ncbi:MAG: aldo/keto reductase [Oscillospiraceae bacterium]|nr:aldo/keto reductase [Oscillospiraceae bacterium]
MKYIALSNGKKLSKIGLGVSRFGTRTPDELAGEMLRRFLAAGGTLIDTARNYYEWVENGRGKSEEFLGRWMEANGCRERIVLSTKGGVSNEGKRFRVNLSREGLRTELRQSLEALRTDHLDIYLLHRDEPGRPVEEIVDSLQELADAGRCGSIGVCNWRCERIRAANQYAQRHGLRPIQLVQTWWSMAAYTETMWDDPTTTHMDQETAEYCREHGCVVMAYTAQAKGFFQKACAVGTDRLESLLKHRMLTMENLKRLEKLQAYCAGAGCTPTDVVLGYVTSNPLSGTALVSCSSLEQLEDVLNSADYVLPGEVIQELDRA